VSLERAEEKREGRIQFDLFELDVKKSQLRRRGLPVDLPPQALKVLGILAEHPNELVTRKEIREALWPGELHGDFDSRMNFAVRKLRETLGDDAERPRYVQTVRNSGYRFIAPVREPEAFSRVLPEAAGLAVHDDCGAAIESGETLATGRRFRLGKGWPFLVFATGVLVTVAAAAVLALRQSKPSQSASIEARATTTTNEEYQPHIDSVTAILPQARQRIVITGRGFGMHVPYARTDSPYLAIRDLSAHWAAGRLVPHNWDEVMVDVGSWTDSEIVVSGFSGEYGINGWKLDAGDRVEIAVWNPQSGVGPALFHAVVMRANAQQ